MKSRNDGFTSDQEYKEYLRTYFAAMAMQSLMVRLDFDKGTPLNQMREIIAKEAIAQTDAIIEQLNKST